MQELKNCGTSQNEMSAISETHSELTRKRSRQGQQGMTLVEIMVVVVIIGLIAGVVGVQVFNRLEEAQAEMTRTQIKNVSGALDLYRLSLRNYPSTAEGLPALVSPKGNAQPFMQEVPTDAWGNELVYIFPGSQNPGGFDLMSYGKDGVQGGGDDIGNWKPAE